MLCEPRLFLRASLVKLEVVFNTCNGILNLRSSLFAYFFKRRVEIPVNSANTNPFSIKEHHRTKLPLPLPIRAFFAFLVKTWLGLIKTQTRWVFINLFCFFNNFFINLRIKKK